MFVLNFVVSGNVTSSPKVMKFMKRSKYCYHDFSAKHTPSATLSVDFVTIQCKWVGYGERYTSKLFKNTIISIIIWTSIYKKSYVYGCALRLRYQYVYV